MFAQLWLIFDKSEPSVEYFSNWNFCVCKTEEQRMLHGIILGDAWIVHILQSISPVLPITIDTNNNNNKNKKVRERANSMAKIPFVCLMQLLK